MLLFGFLSMGWCLMRVPHIQPSSCISGQGTKKTTQELSPRLWPVMWKVEFDRMSVTISKRMPFIFVCITVFWNNLHFPTCGHTNAPKIMDEHNSLFLGDGISSYVTNPPGAGQSLRECLDIAMATVPASQQRTTPVYLGATAGMRLLRWEALLILLNIWF